tara:strand:+ start:4816 stop:5286 length:471 start_codon:yes stop_codon:yes gene_type:complete
VNISERLKYAIEKKGLKITEAVSVSGIPYSSMQNYLRGEREPNINALSKLCLHLGISMNWLLNGLGPVFISTDTEINEPWHPYLATPDKEEVEILALLKKLPDDVKHELLDAAKVKGKVHALEEKMHDMQSQIQAMLEKKKQEQTQQQGTDTPTED